MDRRLVNLLKVMKKSPARTLEELASEFDVTTRTIRNRIGAAEKELADIAVIERRRDGSLSLVVIDADAFDKKLSRIEGHHIPDANDERIVFLFNDLLLRHDWITIETLSELLFVSRSTISSNLKVVEATIRRFGLRIERKPRHGIRVTGSEMSRRLCLASVAAKRSASLSFETLQKTVRQVASCVSRILEEDEYLITAVAFQNLLIHIAIAIERMKQGCYIPLEPSSLIDMLVRREYTIASRLAEEIDQICGVRLPQEEIAYMAIHLSGRQRLSQEVGADFGPAQIISEDVWSSVTSMLDRVWETFRFDFRDDLELRMNLARHVGPLAVRLQYHLRADNPILEDIRSRYPLAYAMACEASAVLTETYLTKLSESEIGYLAIAFALAIERQGSGEQKNILIVCASGAGTAQLIKSQYQAAFGSYLNRIETCDAAHLGAADLTDIDYIFSTVPLDVHLKQPVYIVNCFLNDTETARVRTTLTSLQSKESFMEAFDPRLFLPHLDCATKRDTIHQLCSQAVRYNALPPDFEELVWERERLAPTAFGNHAAMPHPIRAVAARTFVVIGLLDKPINWDGQQVSAVFLICISSFGNASQAEFYRFMSKLFMSAEAIDALTRDRSLNTLFNMNRDGYRLRRSGGRTEI